MHKSIRVKLFLTFLLTTTAVVAGMYAFMLGSLDRGFSGYVESRQKEQITQLIEGLSEYYATDPGWKKLIGNKQKWIEIIWQGNERRARQLKPWIDEALNEPADVWPPNRPESHARGLFRSLELSIMLLDQDGKIIFGRSETLKELTLHPIHYQGQTVGYLGLIPGKRVNQLVERQFMERQTQSFIWIAVFMVLLSAGLALLLAYTLGRPLKRIATAAQALAVGRYDFRLPIETSDELGQLALNFNDMAAALEQSEQARRRWVADISHELRTPLALLRGELEALQDGIRPLSLEAVDSLFGDVMRLNRLTDDLYQLSLSDLGALSYRKVQLDPLEILAEDLAALASEFDSHRLRVDFINRLPDPVSIHADEDRLSQLYRNLLKNSINYTDSGGRLEISAFQQAEQLLIVFADSAPGVAEAEIPHLFDRFYRVEHSRNRHHGGAGLGLAICSNIVQAHGGTIQAKKSALGGLAIHIQLPINS